MKPPKSLDDETVDAWVGKVIEEAKDEAEREFYELRWDTHPGIPMSEIFGMMERDAVRAAMGGDFKPLADMMERKNPVLRGTYQDLRPETKSLIAQRLRDEFRAKRGRAKQTVEQRHINTKIHGAAAEMIAIHAILKRYFPKERRIRWSAITIAAKRVKVKRKTLANYLKSHRRLKTPI